jgi:CHAT domain-containing protein
MKPSDAIHRGLLSAAIAVAMAMDPTAAQTPHPKDAIAQVALAEECFDAANFRQAAAILRPLVDNGSSRAGDSVPTVAATRLLAQVYHRSADFAGAAELAERHARLVPHPDAEMRLLLADCYRALGRLNDARRQLEQFHAAFGNQQARNVADLRLLIQAQGLAAALSTSQATQAALPQSLPADRIAHAAAAQQNVPADQRFQLVLFRAEQSLAENRIDEATALLSRERSTSAYDDYERAELTLRLANCYKCQAEQSEAAGNARARRAAFANERQTLNFLAAALSNRRKQLLRQASAHESQSAPTGPGDDLANLLVQEAALQELQAELDRETQANGNSLGWHLTQAERLYLRLLQLADDGQPAHGDDRSATAGQPVVIAAAGRADHYRDVALCGLQRVYDALRLSVGPLSRDEIHAKLCRVSDRLVAQRSARLLPTDPGLYDARRAQASVYASRDDRHDQQRAADIYRQLVAYWDAGPRSDPQAHAAALVGLAEMLRALDQTRESYACARRANQALQQAPRGGDSVSQREFALLAARIENSLGITLIALGQYSDALKYIVSADRRLEPYGRHAAGLRRENQEAAHVLSRVKVYRGLLHKAEGQYADAARRVREGRELREELDDGADLLAYHLAEASVQLAQAQALRQERGISADDPEVRSALDAAEAALSKAAPFTEIREESSEAGQIAAALPYRYLQALLHRLRGDSESARLAFMALAQESQRHGDRKTAAQSLMQLAQLMAEAVPQELSDRRAAAPAVLSKSEAQQLRRNKLERYAAIQQAAEYAAQAVASFQQMERSVAEDDKGATALPSLHFQAAYLAARLHVLLAALERHLAQLDKLLDPVSENHAGVTFREADSPDHLQAAIDFLHDAVNQAELPASFTTQVRLERARFFSRYAPAYDLLVDLHVAAAVGNGDHIQTQEGSEPFLHLRRAIEIADQARNRTFREQIDGWRESAGTTRVAHAIDWDAEIVRLASPGATLLVYHLDGPQLLNAGSPTHDAVARIGGGHLFVIRDEGRKIQYFRLRHALPGAATSELNRQTARDLVRQHIAWIERPEQSPDWGRAEQRALTEALLPRELLKSLFDASADAPAQSASLAIIPDGALHQLPFESLLVPEDLVVSATIRYVLDELPPIRYGPSLSVLAAIAGRGGQGTSAPRLLTVGNPAYPDRDHQAAIPAWGELLRQVPGYQQGFPALSNSQEECRAVYASFDDLPAEQRTRLEQAAATEHAVRQSLPASRFVHLAAHGCVDYRNDNLLGALVFAPGADPADPQNDGILQLRDIYGLNLSHCELAVLSACQTYVGPERPLEAGTSMARAFLEQGARRVVCSQWGTDDAATTAFMTVFFDAIRHARQAGRQVDYALALHEAKRALRDDSDRRSLPRFWAPFILVGAG